METENIISFDRVSKTYWLYKSDKQRLLGALFGRKKGRGIKEKRAVNDVSFSIKKGEAVAILGKNGAGKSTILKMITGVCFPSKGTIEVNGIVSALLELTAGFDPNFTGRENIYLKGQLMGLKDYEIKELEANIIDFAEVGEYIDQPVRTYSSGMKARLGFSVNVNVHPQILIVDEALSVGDAEFRNKCLQKINYLIEHEHITLLFVTHSTEMARKFCRRGILLKQGKKTFDGSIADAITKYNQTINR